MYQPCATKILMKKRTRNEPVPTQRYSTYGVDWSSSAWYLCLGVSMQATIAHTVLMAVLPSE